MRRTIQVLERSVTVGAILLGLYVLSTGPVARFARHTCVMDAAFTYCQPVFNLSVVVPPVRWYLQLWGVDGYGLLHHNIVPLPRSK
jgi:hypothetical protein